MSDAEQAKESSNTKPSEVLDLSDDSSSEREKAPKEGKPYDPRPVEDGARRTLALLLIGLLWLIIAAILILLAWQVITVQQIKDFDVLLSPIIALVSAATGFYYGAKSSGK
jgi:hypothetical protein